MSDSILTLIVTKQRETPPRLALPQAKEREIVACQEEVHHLSQAGLVQVSI